MPTPERSRRIADQMQRELASMVSLEIKDPRIGMVTITAVEVSRDLKHAQIFVTSLGDATRQAEQLEGLRSAAGYMRGLVGRRLKVHTSPELHFHLDTSIERGFQLTQLIDEAIRQERPDPDAEPPGQDVK
jgi:ribosome-binding factor A